MKNSLTKKQLIFTTVLIGFTVINLFVLSQDIQRLLNYRKVIDHNQIGYQFAGLEQYLVNEKYVGYLSEISLKAEKSSKVFAQAQYMLAPSILDADNLNRPYVIIVSQNPKFVLTKIKELNVVPIAINEQHGVTLTKRP